MAVVVVVACQGNGKKIGRWQRQKYGKGSSEKGQRAAEEISANGRKPPIPRYCLP